MKLQEPVVSRLIRILAHPSQLLAWVRAVLRQTVGICAGGLWPLRVICEKGWIENLFVNLYIPQKSQAGAERTDVIRSLLEQIPADAKVLEIGTYFGEGSTKTFINELGNSASFFAMDRWASYISAPDKRKHRFYRIMDDMSYFAATNTLRVIRKAQTLGDSPSITMIRRSSDDSFFAENVFDLVYIDGSHYYRDVCRDIELALKILKPGGIICGDDLEMQPTDDLVNVARRYPDEDFVPNADGSYFHPGVALAVHDYFETVEMKSGLWWKTISKE